MKYLRIKVFKNKYSILTKVLSIFVHTFILLKYLTTMKESQIYVSEQNIYSVGHRCNEPKTGYRERRRILLRCSQ